MARQHAGRTSPAELLLNVRRAEHHAPRRVSHLAPQLAIHEVGESAEEQSDRRNDGDQIGNFEEVELVAPAKQPKRDRDAGKPAVKRHAALPDRNEADWIAQERLRQARLAGRPEAERGLRRNTAKRYPVKQNQDNATAENH